QHLTRTAGVGPVDCSRLWWTPPLSPRQAYSLERMQIEAELGLKAIVALTDHDSIEAPMLLRVIDESPDVPVSVESIVPCEDKFCHLGSHNHPAAQAESMFEEMARYTADPVEDRLRRILESFAADPETLIVFNHPMWDEKRIGKARHRQRVHDFL